MEKFRKEVMSFVKLEDHLKQHEEINKMFNVDCDSVTIDEHLNYHLEYLYKIGKISENKYREYKE